MSATFAMLRSLQDKRAALQARGSAVFSAAQAAGRDQLSADDLSSLDAIHAEVEGLDRQIAAAQRSIDQEQAQATAVAQREAGAPLPGRGGHLSADPAEAAAQEIAAYGMWMMGGAAQLSERERAILSPYYRDAAALQGTNATQVQGTAASGGYTVPEAAVAGFTMAMRSYAPILSLAEIISTNSTQDIPFVTADDNNSGEWLAELATSTNQDMSFGRVVLKSFRLGSKKIPVSVELMAGYNLADPASLDTLLFDVAFRRMGRTAAQAYVTGTGSGQPTGFSASTTLGATCASTTLPLWTDLAALRDSVDVGYDNAPKAGFVINRLAFSKVRYAVDGNNRPLWQASLDKENGLPTFLDRPYVLMDEMPAAAASAKVAAYGDWSAFKIRVYNGAVFVRVDQPYILDGYVVFMGYTFSDSRLIDAGSHPIKHLAMAAS